MQHLLNSEYRSLLRDCATKWGVDESSLADVLRWTAPLGHLSCSITLMMRGDYSKKRGLIPSVQVGMSGSLPQNASEALVVLADAQATLQKALSCLISLGKIEVFPSDCPCDRCRSTGKLYNSPDPCPDCNGTGYRQEDSE